ncbi:MAG: c-type cytochrome, partial [Maioricimonas sp. JB049]
MSDFRIRQRITTIIAFLVLIGAAGGLVMVSGVVPIKASSGHWPVTKWILNFSKARSVATHSMGIEVPPLDDPTMVMKGAGHFETGCVQCHGSPLRPPSPVARMMTATPPPLTPKIRVRDPEELFYIVKHGIKFTGMPGWPAQNRDDEVWAIVAFLLELPEMDAQTYRALVVPPGDLDEAVTIDGV